MGAVLISMGALLAVSPGPAGLSSGAAVAEKAALQLLRSDNNKALAARDAAKTMQIAADDYVLVGGNDGIHRSKSEMQETWARNFADPAVLPCVRRPRRFDLGEYDGIRRAAETGSWECPVRTGRGLQTLFGRYLAHWSKRTGSWKVVSDNYVTLGCRGPGCR